MLGPVRSYLTPVRAVDRLLASRFRREFIPLATMRALSKLRVMREDPRSLKPECPEQIARNDTQAAALAIRVEHDAADVNVRPICPLSAC